MAESGLPIGFKFQPTDKQVIYFLLRWIESGSDISVLPRGIAATNVYECSPEKLLAGRSEAYFLTPRRRKHKTGTRFDRQAGGGTWILNNNKMAGEILHVLDGHTVVVGYKQVLAFHAGGVKKATGYVMHEYEPCVSCCGGCFADLDVDYVICCIKLSPHAMRVEKEKKKLARWRSSAGRRFIGA